MNADMIYSVIQSFLSNFNSILLADSVFSFYFYLSLGFVVLCIVVRAFVPRG